MARSCQVHRFSTEHGRAVFSAAVTVRYHYHGQIKSIRECVQTALDSARKNVAILPRVGQDEVALNRAIRAWVESAADFGDAHLVATATGAGIANIVSDDAELISFEGLTSYTANKNAIDAAQSAGKLLS